MPKTMTARQIADQAEFLRWSKHKEVLNFEYRKGSRIGLLTNIRFGRAKTGRPTKQTMDCLNNGIDESYHKDYDFEITALVGTNGARIEL